MKNFIYLILLITTIANLGYSQTLIKGPALIEGIVTTVTAAGTTTLTKDSQTVQYFTGSTTQIVVLPNATTLPKGRYFEIVNRSTGAVTVNANGGALVKTMRAGEDSKFTASDVSTAAGVWAVETGIIDLTNQVSGILPLANGGTGVSSLATGFVRSNGSVLSTIVSIDATTALTGAVPIASGGTNNASLAVSAGGVIYADGSKLQNVGAGTSGFYLQSNGASAPSWSAVAVSNPVAAKTANYTLTGSDYFVAGSASGGAFTLTLPTAVGASGKVYILKRTDQTLANIITIATTSSQTIDGVTTKTLATQYEQYFLISDNANWHVLNHTYPQGWNSYSPTITGVGTATNEGFWWRRVGDSLEIHGTFVCGTVTASAFRMSLPSGLTIDTTKLPSSTGSSQFGFMNRFNGSGGIPSGGDGPWFITASTGSSTTELFYAKTITASNFSTDAANLGFANSDRGQYNAARIPITNWNP